MNDCHPTDEVRAFMIRTQPIATHTPAAGVQPRLRGVLAAGGGPSNPCQLPLRGAIVGAGIRECRLPCLGWCLARLCSEMGTIPMVVTATYDPYLVALSILVASFASYTALDLGGRVAARPKDPRTASGWRRPRSPWEAAYGRCTSSPCSPSCCRCRCPTMSA